jgi:hypothetical protein
MTPEERTEAERLVKLIETEKDPHKFEEYVRRFEALVEAKRERIDPEQKTEY